MYNELIMEWDIEILVKNVKTSYVSECKMFIRAIILSTVMRNEYYSFFNYFVCSGAVLKSGVLWDESVGTFIFAVILH